MLNATLYPPDPASDDSIRIGVVIIPIVFACIFVVGLLGNGLLMWTVYADPYMRTPPNVFLVSLAIADSLLLLVSVPVSSTFYVFDEWHFGVVVCKLNEFMQTFSLAVSVFTLTALSFDRYLAIVRPMSVIRWSTIRRTCAVCAVVWVVSLLFALIDVIAAHVGPCPWADPPFLICNLYPDEWGVNYRLGRITMRFVVFFLAPLLIITVFYSGMARSLLTPDELIRDTVRSGTAPGGSNISAKIQRSRKRVAKTVLSFVALFFLCWAPRHVYILWYNYSDDEFGSTPFYIFKSTAFCLTFVYSCVNPLALYVISDEFRQHFDHYLFGRCCKSRQMKPRRGAGESVYSPHMEPRGSMGGRLSITRTPASTPNLSLRGDVNVKQERN